MTKAERVLRYISEQPEGARLIDIQTFIITMNRIPGALDPNTGLRKHEHRGWYCTNLYENRYFGPGSGNSKVGLLLKYCTKLPTGRWIVTEPIVGPWYTMSTPTKSYIANKARKQGEHEARVAKYPICPGCDKPKPPYTDFTADKQTCVHQHSRNYKVDCKGQVWFLPSDRADDSDIMYLTDLTRDQVYLAENVLRAVFQTWDLRDPALKVFINTRTVREK